MTISRRTMLRQLTAILTVPHAVSVLAEETGITDAHIEVLKRATDRLLPGASKAGVFRFFSFWFQEPAFKPVERYFSVGANHLDKRAKKQFGAPFARLVGEKQDEVLDRFRRGEVKVRGFDGQLFFQQLMELTLEGYLSHPKYGGNRDRIGWETIGLPDGLRSCWWNPNGVQDILDPKSGFND